MKKSAVHSDHINCTAQNSISLALDWDNPFWLEDMGQLYLRD